MNLDHLDFDIVSTVRCPVENFVLRISYFIRRVTSDKRRATNLLFTTVKDSLQISSLIMQNEPNFPDDQMNVNKVLTNDYEDKTNWTLGENEPNTNPIYRGVASGEAGSNPISKAKKF